jgi:hypothetical protein
MLGDYACPLEAIKSLPDTIYKKAVLDGLHPTQSILDEHDMKELDITWLLQKIDHTITHFGRWGLQQTLYPTDNLDLIRIQQNRIRALVENPELYDQVKKLLTEIARTEKSLVLQWYDKDAFKRLYFDFEVPFIKVPLLKGLNNVLNNSKLALEFVALYTLGSALKSVAINFFLMGVIVEFQQLLESQDIDKFDLKKGLLRVPKDLLNHINPRRTSVSQSHMSELKNGDPNIKVYEQAPGYGATRKDYWQSVWSGSLGDRHHAMYHGIKYYKPTWWPNAAWIAKKSDQAAGVDHPEIKPVEEYPKPLQWGLWGAAWAPAAAFSAAYYLFALRAMNNSYNDLKDFVGNITTLRERMFDVAEFVKTTQDIYSLVSSNDVFKQDCMTTHMSQVFNSSNTASNNFKDCMKLLQTDTFKRTTQFGPKHVGYSRGNLLLANKLFIENKHEILPVIRAIAELDAAFSMATLYKQQRTTNAPFTFVEFVDHPTPLIEFRSAWMPYFGANNPSCNDILLGGNHSQSNWLITGPNGGGKSALLKNGIGQMIAFAQSWGMVPATSARMTLLNGVRTSTSAKENMREDKSTFMAECKSMDRLYEYIKTIDSQGKYLVIADEPYRGTVNDETARRTGMFCTAVSKYPHVACVIATHIMPEISRDVMQLFSQWHVGILEPQPGIFNRTYTLVPGVCSWWFNDKNRRTRYVDWLKTLISQKE